MTKLLQILSSRQKSWPYTEVSYSTSKCSVLHRQGWTHQTCSCSNLQLLGSTYSCSRHAALTRLVKAGKAAKALNNSSSNCLQELVTYWNWLEHNATHAALTMDQIQESNHSCPRKWTCIPKHLKPLWHVVCHWQVLNPLCYDNYWKTEQQPKWCKIGNQRQQTSESKAPFAPLAKTESPNLTQIAEQLLWMVWKQSYNCCF